MESRSGKRKGEGFLGVMASELDDAMYEALNLDEDGLLVNDVVSDGPAEKAGIKPGMSCWRSLERK